ncbi:flavodoxin [Bacteroides sp.]|uniref:flavodoxin n=1 Tax=Bacteroides sp. TaxID=29523 RepID=UPI003AB631FD
MNGKGLLAMIAMLLFGLVSCSSEESATVGTGDTISGDVGKTLIVYFSWGGNTRMVANHIHDIVGCDIVEVETVIPYPDSYEEVTQIVPGELESDYRPELKTKVENMDEYNTLIVGTPIWGGHLTPAMKSFLASYDLSRKYIAPFCTHGGSGTAQSVSDIRSVCPNSTLLGSLAVYGNQAENSRKDVEKWLKQIGIIE